MKTVDDALKLDEWLQAYAATRIGAQVTSPACKICGGNSRLLDVVDIGRQCDLKPYPDGLLGIPVFYSVCADCGLIFTTFFDDFDDAAWTRYVYNGDYARIDPQYGVTRARHSLPVLRAAIAASGFSKETGCDFGGGQGDLAHLLTSSGYAFDSFDPFGQKLISKQSYPIVSAIEVLEHFSRPRESFSMLAGLLRSDRCLAVISTLTFDGEPVPGRLSQWWYAAPRNGHCTIYTRRALERLAGAQGLEYCRVTRGLHIFGRGLPLTAIRRKVLAAKVLQRLRFS